jgi:hypothetical protein
VTKRVTPFDILIGDKTKLRVIGSGQVKLRLDVNGKAKKCTVKDVLHVPMLGYNLISISTLESNVLEMW